MKNQRIESKAATTNDLTASMLDVLEAIGNHPVTADEVGGNSNALVALAKRGLLHADRDGSPIIYSLTSRGRAVVELLNAPVEFRPCEGALARIQRVAAHHYRVPVEEMWSARRARPAVRARQVAMYFARELTPLSLPNIGQRFGKRDHTTVIHALRKVEELINTDVDFRDSVTALRDELSTVVLGRSTFVPCPQQGKIAA